MAVEMRFCTDRCGYGIFILILAHYVTFVLDLVYSVGSICNYLYFFIIGLYLQKLQVDISNTRVILYGSSLHYIKAKPITPCLLFFGTYVLHFKLNRCLSGNPPKSGPKLFHPAYNVVY